jgi:hypothetical protein
MSYNFDVLEVTLYKGVPFILFPVQGSFPHKKPAFAGASYDIYRA